MATRIDTSGDVYYIRMLLDEAGKMEYRTVEDEPLITATTTKLYLDYQNIEEVTGVWDVDDLTHTGTNYMSGSSAQYNTKGGYVVLDPAASANMEVIATYTYRKGLSDDEISFFYELSKMEVNAELFVLGDGIDFSGTSNAEILAKYVAYLITAYRVLLVLNSGNVIQAGFSYGAFNYDVQTKLWGEGMSTGELLREMKDRITALKALLKANSGNVVYVSDLNTTMPSYKSSRRLQAPDWIIGSYTDLQSHIDNYLGMYYG